MSFNALFMAHAPDANPDDVALVETPTYKLYSVAVKGQAEALATARKLVDEKGVESIILCPGFSNKDIAELDEAVGEGVGVSVSRGDAPSQACAVKAMQREGWRR
jgi:stage V sporulation protein SpoVS